MAKQQDLLPMLQAEDSSTSLSKGSWLWPPRSRRSSLITNPLAMQQADSAEHALATRAEQYCPPHSSAYGSALVSELREDDHSFFSDKTDLESEAPTLAAALGARRSSILMPTSSHASTCESLSGSKKRPVSRHVSHIGYGQAKVLSRLRRSSNGDDEVFPISSHMRRRSYGSCGFQGTPAHCPFWAATYPTHKCAAMLCAACVSVLTGIMMVPH